MAGGTRGVPRKVSQVQQEQRASRTREYEAQLHGIRARDIERDKRVALLSQQNGILLDFVAT
ncbi:hypothetical protein [Caballeronia choica]|uniref:hypothetical protein n=1 Tax=Caballeronia choica TaxID=326476 RepID=UPI000AC2C29B|nr:hypothetical protein [Caballeronia choica]